MPTTAQLVDQHWGVEPIEEWFSGGRRWRMVEGFGCYWLQMLRTYHSRGQRFVIWVFWKLAGGAQEAGRGVCGDRAMEIVYGLKSNRRLGYLSFLKGGPGFSQEYALDMMKRYTEIPDIRELALEV